MDRKADLSAILAKAKTKYAPEEEAEVAEVAEVDDMEDDGEDILSACAEELLTAIEAKDVAGIKEALKSAFESYRE